MHFVKSIAIEEVYSNLYLGRQYLLMLLALVALACSIQADSSTKYKFSGSTLTISNVWQTNRADLMEAEKTSLVSISDITTVTINEGVHEIGVKTFWFFINLENVIIPNSVSKIHDCAFYHCHSLESIDIPDSVSSIGNYGFSFCISLISVTIPSKVTAINQFTFSVCHSLKSIIFHKNSLVDILDEGCFEYCITLESIELPINLDLISKNAFKSCSSLQEVRYCGYKVFYPALSEKAFVDCKNLYYILVPSSYSIDKFMEKSVYKLLDEKCMSSVPIPTFPPSPSPSWSSPYFRPVILPNYTLELTELILDNWSTVDRTTLKKLFEKKNFDIKYLTKVIIKEGTEIIEYRAFTNSYDLMEVMLPDSLQEISGWSFENCYNLSKINFPKNLITIKECAFSNCYCLKEVEIPDSVAEIGSGAFDMCKSLEKVVLHGRNLRKAELAYVQCELLNEFHFCGSGDFRNNNVFYTWLNLKSVSVKNNYKYDAFSKLPVRRILNNNCEIEVSTLSPTHSPTRTRSLNHTKSKSLPTRSPSLSPSRSSTEIRTESHTRSRYVYPTKQSPLPTRSKYYYPTKPKPLPTRTKINYVPRPTKSGVYPVAPPTSPNKYKERISDLETYIKYGTYLVIALIALVAICFGINIILCVWKVKGDKESQELEYVNENINESLIIG